MTEEQLENLLRQAPQPVAPPGLKRQLEDGIRLRAQATTPRPEFQGANAASLWRRWFPALSFGMLILGCAVVLGVQITRVIELRRENSALRAATANLEQLRQDNGELQRRQAATQQARRERQDEEQLLQARAEVARLRAGLQDSAAVRAESQRLAAEHAAAVARAGLTAEADPFQESEARADRVHCINNIKQIGLAARMWANDHKEVLPADFLSLTNELPSPRLLTCVADTARTPARNWQEFDGSSVSYELLSPQASERDPGVVFVRCPIHQNVGLVDGSALQLNPKRHQVVKVEGKFKIVTTPEPTSP